MGTVFNEEGDSAARLKTIEAAAQVLVSRVPEGFDAQAANADLYDDQGLPR